MDTENVGKEFATYSKSFGTMVEAEEYVEALLAEDDVECEIAFLSDTKGGGVWIVTVDAVDTGEDPDEVFAKNLTRDLFG